jgi:hypothetical protein
MMLTPYGGCARFFSRFHRQDFPPIHTSPELPRPSPHTSPIFSSSHPPAMRYTASVIVLFSISLLATAHDHGSTSDDSSSSSMDGHMMVPYLHTTPGDALFFKGWIPRSSGAIGGACVGLFLLAILERWVNAMNGVAASSWARR